MSLSVKIFAPILFGVFFAVFSAQANDLKITDLVVGEGVEAQVDKQVSVHYTGWLMNGQKFDSSKDRQRPFNFIIGSRQVISGWDEGVVGMKVGGKRELIIPPALAYGSRGVGEVIPPESTLRFEIELLGVTEPPFRNIDNDQLKALLKDGVKIVDIRTPAEWQETGVVEGSLLLPFILPNGKGNKDFVSEMAKLAKPDEKVILICRSGNRTNAASQMLTSRFGYTHIYNVRRGIKQWLKESNPTVAPDESALQKHL